MSGLVHQVPFWLRKAKLLSSQLPGWRNISLAKTIEARLGIPTFLEHDANASALAEKWFGKGTTANHLVFIAVGQGVGAGVLANGQILSGHLNVAGEISRTIDYNGPLCDCGNQGCLEMYSSEFGFGAPCQETARDEQPPGWPKPEEIDAEKVFALAPYRGRDGAEAHPTGGSLLGIRVVNVINTYNPDMIVLGDEMAEAGEPWLQAVKEVVEKRVIPELRSETIIEDCPNCL